MRAAYPVVSAVVLALAVTGCGRGATESSLTKAQVEKKLTAKPAAGLKKLRTASCKEEKTKNKYRCDVTTVDGDGAILIVIADGDDLNIDAAQRK